MKTLPKYVFIPYAVSDDPGARMLQFKVAVARAATRQILEPAGMDVYRVATWWRGMHITAIGCPALLMSK